MKFKAGDKVRFKRDRQNGVGTITELKHFNGYKQYLVNSKNITRGHDGIHTGFIQDNKNNWWFREEDMELANNDYITTKNFIKEVEKLGYELDIRTGVIFIKTKNFREVGWVRTDYECSAAFNFECDKLLLDIFYLYANTPLELREEPKKYKLALPNNNLSRRYYAQNKLIKERYKFTIKGKGNNNTYKADFTQQEIDNLPNQELIKCLIEKEVKND